MTNLFKVFMPQNIHDDLAKILYSGQLAFAHNAKKFEIEVGSFIGNRKLIAVGNANLALHLALDLLELATGDEIISSPVSCLATNQPILNNKCKVVWCDIDPSTGTMDPQDLCRRITKRTKAIIHYHWCGYPGYIDEINKIARDEGIYVIEDATEAFGALYKGKHIGNTGSDIVCFSFGPVRIPTTIEGGAIAFSEEKLYNKALLMRDYGIDRKKFRDLNGEISLDCDIPIRGYGALMNEINGYIGLTQLRSFSHLIEMQRSNIIEYEEQVQTIQSIKSIWRSHTTPSFWVYTILSDARDNLLQFLRQNGIQSSKVHLRNDRYSCFHTSQNDDLKGVDEFTNRELCIPSGWWLTIDDTRQIALLLKRFAYDN